MKRIGLLLTGLLAPTAALAQTPLDLARLSVEELSNVEVTSVSKRPERLADAAASVFVISNDDIRRSGLQTLPEALRLAPNLNVQRIDALDYGISARGLNGFESANKLLVLIDGRSVYSPFFSGVEWAQLHPNLPDVDRIEVVSGPGGTLWGANAVNGVVNIVSRPADLTQGILATAAAGDGYQSYVGRYGGRLGAAGAYRVYARAYERADTLRNGRDAGDGWRGGQVGFRTDFEVASGQATVQGDAYDDDVPSQIPARPEGKLSGHNLLGRWTRSFGETAEFEVQAYYDRYERLARGISDAVSTYDVQAQQRWLMGRHRLVAGVGYRRWSDEFANYVNAFTLDPPTSTQSLANAFVQDQIDFGDVTLTLGIKAERSSFSGTEWLPNLHLSWRATPNALFWGGVSRAVRNPSRLDRDLVFLPLLVRSNFQPEELIAYELGYRGQPAPRFALSATAYFHQYQGVRSTESTPVTVTPLRIGNGLEGETWGIEAWADLDVTDHWRLGAGVHAMAKDFRRSPGSLDRSSLASSGHDPDAQFLLRSQHQLARNLHLDVRLRHVTSVPAAPVASYLKAPAYSEADARLAWRVTDRVELALAGFNLFDKSHPEATEPRRTEMRRNYQISLRYGW